MKADKQDVLKLKTKVENNSADPEKTYEQKANLIENIFSTFILIFTE